MKGVGVRKDGKTGVVGRAIGVAALLLALQAVGTAQTTFYFPQIADGTFGGGFFTTTIFVTNPASAGSANVTLTFTTSAGGPFNVAFVDSNSQPAGAGNVISLTSLAAGQSRKLVSTAGAPLGVGFATVTSDAPVTATAVFSQLSGVPGQGTLIAEAAVTSANAATSQGIFVDQSGGNRTAMAFANVSPTTPANLTFTLHGINTTGVPVLTTTRPPLGAVSHTSIFVDELFSADGTSATTNPLVIGHVGTLNVTSSVPVALVSLRFNGLLFTSVPPFSLAALISPIEGWLGSASWPAPLAAFGRVLSVLGEGLLS